MYTEQACADRWARLLAPRSGSVREDLTGDLARYLGISPDAVRASLSRATETFAEEWRARVQDPKDSHAVVRFYEESTTELFDLAEWHASDAIHYRTLVCLDLLKERAARTVLDYGSGIGSDAIALSEAGFDVTLADVSGPLLAFATWRCRDRGFDVSTVDLKVQQLPARAYDGAICFDVLEHVPDPVGTVRGISESMRRGGLLFVHAPFGVDRDRPMHIVEKDVVTPRMRTLGFEWREDLARRFPKWLWAPHVYESVDRAAIDRLGYYVHDVALPGSATRALAKWYRRLLPNLKRRPDRVVVRDTAR